MLVNLNPLGISRRSLENGGSLDSRGLRGSSSEDVKTRASRYRQAGSLPAKLSSGVSNNNNTPSNNNKTDVTQDRTVINNNNISVTATDITTANSNKPASGKC